MTLLITLGWKGDLHLRFYYYGAVDNSSELGLLPTLE